MSNLGAEISRAGGTSLNTINRRVATLAPVLIVLAVGGASSVAQDADTRLATLERLSARLSGLGSELQLLEDSKAIKRLQRAYGYYVDKGLADEVIDLFSQDATAELGGLGVFVGKERVAELYRYLLGDGLDEGELNNHMILQGVVHVDPGGMTAKGRWRALIQLGQHGESATWSEGPYENEYVKENGVWRIAKLHWYMTFSSPYDPGWHLAPQPMAGPLEDLPPDLPPSEEYEAYPSAYLPAYHYDNPVSGRPAGGRP
jgi:hypothetical protein